MTNVALSSSHEASNDSSEASNDSNAPFDALVALLHGKRVAVLTGAGISTESGIPDYRGPETRRRARNPIQGREFVASEDARRRYWARALLGWRRFADKRPAAGHQALAELEAAGVLTGLVTQNVDRLHHGAGSRNVVELHGSLHEVVCLGCGALSPREPLQAELARRNPGWVERVVEMAPDGDAELDDVRGFEVVPCVACGGALKPHVVFFGEGVPKERVDTAWAIVDAADVLLVVGSSLAVFSGYRFVRGAAKRGQPVAIVNLGETRGDVHASIRVDARAGDVLPALVTRLR
ncbi:MAG: NAD-dependent protein deacetylase [Sandaracinus sp.]|nr:NAD-dependent protein deacetylase [Myxococcales bacterium]MCB9612141.1 NAD-dependent protein deacetylase [Sandaracinus sp.]MCB9636261.1 NAD-dependent protein deacetylase [Sandaracinus sp.]